MESVINKPYVESYARAYSNLVLKSFFNNHRSITGEEILNLSGVKQINLMVIKNLMNAWISEAEKLKSPYFNFESEEVVRSLTDFMNVLSRNIKVEEENIKPLLENAVKDTLLLIFSPYEYFHKELGKSKNNISVHYLASQKKFIKINASLFDSLLDKIKSTGKDEFSPDELKNSFNQVCEEINFEPEDPDQYIEKFSEKEPLFVQKIYTEPDPETKERTIHESSPPAGEEVGSAVYEKYLEKKETLADKIKKESPTFLDLHQKQRIDSIRKNISIQQKFMFVKELFQNNDEEFNQVIDFLDQCGTMEEAIEYLDNNYFNPGNWSNENEAVIEFMTVIDKKFI